MLDKQTDEAINKTTGAVIDFAAFLCAKQGLLPIHMLAVFSIALVSAHHSIVEKGKEDEAFGELIAGLRILFDECVQQDAEQDAEEARREGKIQ